MIDLGLESCEKYENRFSAFLAFSMLLYREVLYAEDEIRCNEVHHVVNHIASFQIKINFSSCALVANFWIEILKQMELFYLDFYLRQVC